MGFPRITGDHGGSRIDPRPARFRRVKRDRIHLPDNDLAAIAVMRSFRSDRIRPREIDGRRRGRNHRDDPWHGTAGIGRCSGWSAEDRTGKKQSDE